MNQLTHTSLFIKRILWMLAFCAGVFVVFSLLFGLWEAQTAMVSQKSPFGVGSREAVLGGSATGGFAGQILVWQSGFYRTLTEALLQLKTGAGAFSLILFSFLYGVFHAAGPGHGKVIISGYLLASKHRVMRGVVLSFAAALMQSIIAISLTAVLIFGLNATAQTTTHVTRILELISYTALALLGIYVLWRSAKHVFPSPAAHHVYTDACRHGGCGHVHVHAPQSHPSPNSTSWRETWGVIFTAGLRPCTGALIVLTLAVSQNLFWVGCMAVLMMGLGTALTTSSLAVFSMVAKRAALALASRTTQRFMPRLLMVIEGAAGATLVVVGLALVLGLWRST
jgi:nickel/cobalt transporter (NicO) family protein